MPETTPATPTATPSPSAPAAKDPKPGSLEEAQAGVPTPLRSLQNLYDGLTEDSEDAARARGVLANVLNGLTSLTEAK